MNEQQFLDQLRGFACSPTARGLADDCAVLDDLVLTHDMMLEGVHYLPDANPADVAWKLVARNLSDLAAKGAKPLGVLLGYVLGDEDWDTAFAHGLRDALSHYETALWGGDTAASGPAAVCRRVLGMTAIGRAAHLPVPARAGARAGDDLWLAGTIGGAWWAYEALHNGAAGAEPMLLQPLLRPRALIAEGAALAAQATAMMDVSDGLLLDASRLAQASGLCAVIDSSKVPFAPVLGTATPEQRAAAMRFGDDYALLFTLPPNVRPAVKAQMIGTMRAAVEPNSSIMLDGAAPAGALGWTHG